MVAEYRVALDVYNGPLDLLLFLIRREEVEIQDIPIARVLEQYLASVELIKQLDPESVGDFLVLAATLMEIKSRMLLPTPPPEEEDDDILDPRVELVRQLLEYKKFKDAARYLDQAAADRAMRHERSPVIEPLSADEFELDNVDIWDLFNAFNRVLEQTGRREAVTKIGIDDTPITLHAEDILDSIDRSGGSQQFEDIFAGREKPELIGLFLALLELIRQRRIRATQDKPFDTIWIHLIDKTPLDVQLAEAAFETSEEQAIPDGEEPTEESSAAPTDDEDDDAAPSEEPFVIDQVEPVATDAEPEVVDAVRNA